MAGYLDLQPAAPGVLVVSGPQHQGDDSTRALHQACDAFTDRAAIPGFPLIVIVDDSRFAAASLDNFLWTTFTRSNPAVDVYGFGASTQHKHFGCTGSLVIDARCKPQHAPGLIEDSQIQAKVDARATRGDTLAKYL